MKTLQEIKLNEITENLLQGNYLCDMAHEYADSSAEVIYYANSREYVNNHNDVETLEDEWRDLGYDFESLDTLYTQLAFIGVKNDYLEQFNEEVEEDLEKLKEILNDNQVELDCIEYDREDEIEEMESIQNEIEDAISTIEDYM